MASTLAFIAIFVTVVGAVVIGYLTTLARRQRLAPPEPDETAGPSLVEQVVARQPPTDWQGRVDRRFDRLVHNTMLGLTGEQATAIILLTGAVLASAAFFFWEEWWISAIALLLGMLIPTALFLVMQARWRRAIQDQLPDGCFLLARSLRAGLSLEQALVVGADYSLQPLAGIFRRCAEQIQLGQAAPTVLERMAETVGLADFDALASVLILHRTTGGNLPEMLDRLAAGIRDRNQFRGYFRAATALSTITAIFVGAAAPVIGIAYAIFYPDLFAGFFRSTAGILALTTAVILEILGVLWLTWLLRRLDY